MNMEPAKRLKTARTYKGLTAAELGKAGHVSFQAVYKYEQGLRRIPDDLYDSFAQALGVTPEWLRGNGQIFGA